jgi:hypothetical protein
MADIELFTLAIAVILPISSLICSNSRIAGFPDSLNKRLDDFRAEVNRRCDEFDRKFENQQSLLEAIISKLDELNRRMLRP